MKRICICLVTVCGLLFGSSTRAQTPTISSFSPSSGPIGTLVTITGTNLANPTAFSIAGATAIVISNTGTSLVGLVMPGAAFGAVNLTTAGGIAPPSTNNFNVTGTPYPSAQEGNKLVGTGSSGFANQGHSVAVSADGNTAVVGGFNDNPGVVGNINAEGAVWVFTRTSGVWTQQGSKLVGTGSAGPANQGWALALSADGNTIIVGGRTGKGVWIFTRNGNTWSQQGSKLTPNDAVGVSQFGSSVAISADGNTAIAGGEGDGSKGAVWIYTRSGGTWTQQGSKLVGTGAVGNSGQGFSVALSADGNTAMAGGYADNSNQGAAWVFTRSGGTWSQQGNKLVGTGAVGNAGQGCSVALSADGNTAMVGGNLDNSNQGAGWVFTRSGSTWSQQGSKLVGTGGQAGPRQGNAVSLSADGNTAIVAGSLDNGPPAIGATWVFTRSGSTWTQQGTKLVGTGAVGTGTLGNVYQGYSVSLSADGTTAIVGGVEDNSSTGAAWVFTGNTPPVLNTNATLSVLTISAGTLTPAFASGTTSYTAAVSNATSSITITPTTSDAGATVKVKGVAVISGSASGSIALAVGKNVIPIVVTAQNTLTTKTYSVSVTRALSANANLSALAVSSVTLSPVFAPGTTNYTASVGNAITSVKVTPTLSDTTASLTVNGVSVAKGSQSGSIILSVGSNTITTVVTAQDGTSTKTYTVTVTRAASTSTNANLSALSQSPGILLPGFSSGTTSYTASVSNSTTSITVTPTVSDAAATVKVKGVAVSSGSASGSIALAMGSNIVTIVVTAGDGSTTKTYTVNITRTVSANANLTTLSISKGALTPMFVPATISYTAMVINGISAITVTPTLSDTTAALKVNGNTVSNGNPSSDIALTEGANTITIVVTAQDGTTTKTYTILLTRASAGESTATAEVSNVLSPNGDGKNDFWVIKDIALYPNNIVKIFDRAGRLLYTKENYANDWDGTIRGTSLRPDTYYYIIDFGSGAKPIKGYISIVRKK